MFVNTFWSLVPPIVAIGLALLTKETYSSGVSSSRPLIWKLVE